MSFTELIAQKFEKIGFVKSLESQAREVYANTVKCRTIKPKHNVLGTTKDRIVLGLNDDPACDYEQRSVLVKQNDNRAASKEEPFFPKENADIQTTESTMPDIELKNEEILEPEGIETNENLITPSDSMEEDKEISKDLMGSIGSWINEFFSVPTKRPVTVPQMVNLNQKPESGKVDNECLKSFNVFKEQMKKKLKNETTVHLSPGDKFLEFNFDKLTNKKTKKKSSWLSLLDGNKPVEISRKKNETVSQSSNPNIHKFAIKINDKENIYVTLRAEDGAADAKESILINEKLLKKERSKGGKLEEYFFATPPELSRSLLLNINDQEKCSQLYKNAHARIQEPQPYQLRRTNSIQRNARCYTTNANLVENSKANSLINGNKKSKRPVFYVSDSASTNNADECLRKKISLKRKSFSELPGDESTTCDKIRSTKSLNISFSESNKNDLKTSSEDLVKHLIKKTKVTGRPQPFKKKSKSLVPEGNPRSRFLQSATTSLVVNVLAKKENNLLTLKAGSRLAPEKQFMKSDREIKEWSAKHRDIRFEIKKGISPRFNKSSYLSDVSDKPETQNDNGNLKPLRRLNENLFMSSSRDERVVKGQNGKSKRGEDIKHILSKIDGRYDTLKTHHRLKKTEEENELTEAMEAQNARFQKQHELFKKVPKTSPQQTEDSQVNEGTEYETEDKPDSSTTTASPTEVIILDSGNQVSKKPEENEKYELEVLENSPSLSSLSDTFESASDEVLDRMYSDEKPFSPKTEKNETPNYKNKLVKTKSLQYLKEEDMRTLLSSTTELHDEEESQNQKQNSKNSERQLPPTEIRPQKTLEPVLLNRSYSTSMLARNQKPTKLIPFGHPKSVLTFSDEKKDCEKKGAKDKRKDKNEKTVENCGFQPPKKPGPNCEKSDCKS